jgi:glycosyltransferase involved in cell wall biosynthesis
MRILHLSHVGPIKQPTGGIIHVMESIKNEIAHGHDSHWISIRTDREIGLKTSSHHLRIGKNSHNERNGFGDWNLSQEIANSEKARQFLKREVKKFQPDLLVFEGPWLWPIYMRASNEFPFLREIQHVYSAHNVEHILIPKIYESRGMPIENLTISRNLLKNMEAELISSSLACISLSSDDAEALKENKAKHIIQASNGITIQKSNRISAWKVSRCFQPQNVIALFVSSNWDPHVLGLRELLNSKQITELTARKIQIVIVGSIIDSFSDFPESSMSNLRVIPETIVFLGRIKSSDFGALLDRANVFVLPISFGGGKGIKTSEALSSSKLVLGTKSAFRGFAISEKEQGVITVNSSPEILDCLIEAVDKKVVYNQFKRDSSEHSWSIALKPWLDWLDSRFP